MDVFAREEGGDGVVEKCDVVGRVVDEGGRRRRKDDEYEFERKGSFTVDRDPRRSLIVIVIIFIIFIFIFYVVNISHLRHLRMTRNGGEEERRGEGG